jgi:hypothetical protein
MRQLLRGRCARSLRRDSKHLIVLVLGFHAGACAPPGADRQFTALADSVILQTREPIVLQSSRPLRTPAGHGIGEVCFEIPSPNHLGDGFSIQTEAGGLIELIVEVLNSAGDEHRLTLPSRVGRSALCFGPRKDETFSPPFDRVRLTSSEPLVVKEVRWASTDK